VLQKRGELLWITLIILLVLSSLIFVTYFTDRAATAYSAFTKEQKTSCIIIDAGHGGVDGGAVSCTGVYESQINLEIARRLNDLMQLLGYRTKMIRTEDISVYTNGKTIAEKKVSDLKERVRIINDTDHAILISIHQNYFQDNRYSGAQVFYSQNSEAFARLVQKQFNDTLNIGSTRKAKEADGIYLMERIKGTGILIECGFLSNHVEEQNLRNADYQKKICCVIASSTACYIKEMTVA